MFHFCGRLLGKALYDRQVGWDGVGVGGRGLVDVDTLSAIIRKAK